MTKTKGKGERGREELIPRRLGGLTDDWPRTFCLGSTHQRLALTIYLGGETERENNHLGKGEKDQFTPQSKYLPKDYCPVRVIYGPRLGDTYGVCQTDRQEDVRF